MKTIDQIKQEIREAIKNNGKQEITGNILQGCLLGMCETFHVKLLNNTYRLLLNSLTFKIEDTEKEVTYRQAVALLGNIYQGKRVETFKNSIQLTKEHYDNIMQRGLAVISPNSGRILVCDITQLSDNVLDCIVRIPNETGELNNKVNSNSATVKTTVRIYFRIYQNDDGYWLDIANMVAEYSEPVSVMYKLTADELERNWAIGGETVSNPVYFYRAGNIVTVTGTVQCSVNLPFVYTPILTIPVGFRPYQALYYPQRSQQWTGTDGNGVWDYSMAVLPEGAMRIEKFTRGGTEAPYAAGKRLSISGSWLCTEPIDFTKFIQ